MVSEAVFTTNTHALNTQYSPSVLTEIRIYFSLNISASGYIKMTVYKPLYFVI